MGHFQHSTLYYSEFKKQISWRKDHIKSKEYGFQVIDKVKGEPIKLPHIVPFEIWLETVWEGIREELNSYICQPGKEIHTHDGTHNLLSSWVLCANLYFPARTNPGFRALMKEFLKENVSDKVTSIEDVELEFAFPEDDFLHPKILLGETTGSRGKKQTSPDIAFLVRTNDGNDGIILTESKYTELHFYPCSTNPENDKYKNRNLNPDFSRCMKPAKGYDYKSICHQTNAWDRKYMNLLNFSEQAENALNNCPAATDGYQLFRQQALAEGIANSGRFELVVSSVAFDGRNTDLIHCLKSTGANDFQSDWAPLFTGETVFKTWTHQEWVQFVRDNQKNNEFTSWLEYLNERYGY